MRERAATMAATAAAARALLALKRKAVVTSVIETRIMSEAAEKLLTALRHKSPLCTPCASERTELNKWEVMTAILELMSARKALASPSTRCSACGEVALVVRPVLPFTERSRRPSGGGGSLLDQGDSAAVYCQFLARRSREAIIASRALIAESRELRAMSRRVILRFIRGAADGVNASGDAEAHVRHLIATLPKETPRIYAGRSRGARCDVCGRDIVLGAPEYEAEFTAFTLRLDRTCLAMWQREVAANEVAED